MPPPERYLTIPLTLAGILLVELYRRHRGDG